MVLGSCESVVLFVHFCNLCAICLNFIFILCKFRGGGGGLVVDGDVDLFLVEGKDGFRKFFGFRV